MLGQSLADAGFEQIYQESQGQDLSAGTSIHESLYEDYRVLFHPAQPFLLNMGVTTAQEFEQLYQQMLQEMRSSRFRSIGFDARVWGKRPG